nr:hypothetical protein [Tissierella sp.]
MNLTDLNDYGHDVYEFCYADKYPDQFWNESSIFIIMEDFSLLSSYLDKVFLNFHYYGPQKVSLDQWEKVKDLYLSQDKIDQDMWNFFEKIDIWIKSRDRLFNYFWILGV